MPWRGHLKGDQEWEPTLGYVVAEWIEANCVIPDTIHQGEPFRLTNEQLRFLLNFYRLRPDAKANYDRPSAPFVYRGALLMRPQKWGKGPFASAICLAEALGPVRFGGWDKHGEPIGRPQPTPWVQIVATSEEQTDNVWLALHEMATRGRIAETQGIDIGLMDINLADGGKIEPRSASGRARLGGRITFANFDETGLMVQSNGGVNLATTMKRNLAGMGGRWLETSNSYDPSEQSIAQRTHESPVEDVFVDYRPALQRPDLNDDEDCLASLRYVYGDSWWVDVERILADARDPAVCPTVAEGLRFFWNLITVGVSDVVDPVQWRSLAREHDLQPGEMIALGFDGSRSGDLTSIVASRITDGRWFHIKTWDPADYPDHKVPRGDVDQMMAATFSTYDVHYLYMDPYYWEEYADLWSSREPKKVVVFPTNVDKRMDAAIARFLAAVGEGLTHDGDQLLTQHINAAALAKGHRKQPRPEEDPSIITHYLKIVKKRSTGHIDALIAGILAEQARGKAIEEGALVVPVVAAAWR